MNIAQLQQGIEAKFAAGTDQTCRLLFWYDPEQSFKEALASIALPGITVLDMADLSILKPKNALSWMSLKTVFCCTSPMPSQSLKKTGFSYSLV